MCWTLYCKIDGLTFIFVFNSNTNSLNTQFAQGQRIESHKRLVYALELGENKKIL